ncbi:MAG: ABC transporter permease [Rhizobiales bacterium 24-66-13]|jgi:peptide/nickel transport system permease protein|nr:MAG: ABC transporter permease [Rhizobiales bacterium 32-66-11]OYY14019.1 MAG: ABC transporter permease [Rhizobiales bacterium 35-68-8]OYZ83109.1 MAG: ABC transporter permease [Rhizobiales bacterium 24-66-13]OZB12039.1 MAG: ABC transporter permease [Rhizobiales bacterium 39-66-18]HQS45626.1 ABC transporter permease [Xanthobacteraceae bacterium]
MTASIPHIWRNRLGAGRSVLRLLGRYVAVLLFAATLSFALVHLAPGDAATVMAGEQGAADATYMAQLREEFGLDRPLAEQFAVYTGRLAQLDLGYSYRYQRTVLSLVAERLPATLLLTATAFLLALGMGIAVGVLGAMKAGTFVDVAIGAAGLVAYATPSFWAAMLAVLVFSDWLGWLPAFGMGTVGVEGLPALADIAAHLVLPAATLALFHAAAYAQMTRAAMAHVLAQDYIRTALAKGVSRTRLALSHALRNALLPVLTLAGLQASMLLGGSVLVETVFAWPGLGRLAFEALQARDINLLLGIFLVTSALVVAVNLLVDAAYRLADPRIGAGP